MTVQPEYPDGVKTPTELHAEQLADPDITPIETDVAVETGPQPVKTVAVELPTGKTVNVPMMSEWRQSALNAMQAGDFDTWAELVLAETDWDAWDEWRDQDPKLGESQAFFRAVGKATGEAAAGNRASRRQFARTQRR
ncbi:hypothetical protein KIH74_22900 [Kineosporia sp. J2-2]|uniref:Uncharacterized protein n=1 Tax=Kineosporia corallincola TaxID=2835133 RepID=A0ABS5TP25_9ACTN|nr:hypothetical protein [Kineosporia corallincola]MBT0771808.1 hypothetical protein [Kineosporia corallincola]